MTINTDANIKQFLNGKGKNKGRDPYERYSSFDYCFNYFQDFRDRCAISDLGDKQNMQTSCLQLAFYLASWGMFRGSSFMLEKSAKHLEKTIALIAQYDRRLWSIDVDSYNIQNIDLLRKCYERLADSLETCGRREVTLVTKVMLGVFGNTPAFDEFFCKAFHVGTFNRKSLLYIADFYAQNRNSIDGRQVYTFGFGTGRDTSRTYTKAKIIDMIGFIEGQNIAERKKEEEKKREENKRKQ